MAIDMDVNIPGQAVGHSVIDVDLGVGGRRLLVISGTACPEWHLDSDELHRNDCRLNLRVQAGDIESATVYAGLAAIGNADSDWVFAVDSARLETAPTGDLVLFTNLALLGETSDLHRFSYQVVVVKRVVNSEITGTITWPTAALRPASSNPTDSSGNFRILANFRDTTTTSSPFGPLVHETLTPVTPGSILTVRFGEQTCEATYRIADPPKGRELRVTVEPIGFNEGSAELSVDPVNGSDIFTLTPASPSREHVDFVITLVSGGPH